MAECNTRSADVRECPVKTATLRQTMNVRSHKDHVVNSSVAALTALVITLGK